MAQECKKHLPETVAWKAFCGCKMRGISPIISSIFEITIFEKPKLKRRGDRMQTGVRLNYKDNIATITLVPPNERKPPTLDFTVIDYLEEVIEEIREKIDTVAVVLRSTSAKYFCAGGNLEELGRIDEKSIGSWIIRGHEVFNLLENIPAPVIAVINGYALGGGLELALSADIMYVCETARLGQTEPKVGFVSGWGGSYRLSRRIGVSRAKELFFTAKILSAEEAYSIGIAEFVGPPDAVEERLASTLESIRGNSSEAVREMKRILNCCYNQPPAAVAREEAASSLKLLRETDTLERVKSFLRDR